LRRAVKNLRRNTLRGTLQTIRAMIEDQGFDWRYGVDTSGSVALNELTIDSRHVVHGAEYTPTRARYFREILRALRVPEDSILVDIGAGKGRILMLAAQFGCFRKVVGVEFSADLCRTAERNIRRFQPSRYRRGISGGAPRCCRLRRAARSDLFFMFNPFDYIVMQHVIDHIAHSLEEVPRAIWLIYLNVKDDCRTVLVESGYRETDQVNYGNANASIFANDGDQLRERR
jgi:precorrin-6B methylase 2